jgi:hypothetical protein
MMVRNGFHDNDLRLMFVGGRCHCSKVLGKGRVLLGQIVSVVELASCTSNKPEYLFGFMIADAILMYQYCGLEPINAQDAITVYILG